MIENNVIMLYAVFVNCATVEPSTHYKNKGFSIPSYRFFQLNLVTFVFFHFGE